MATWKKVIVSGSAADLASLTLDTTLAVAEGGTGATTLTDGGVLLGSGTGAITATAVLTDGQMLVGDGTTDPAIESGATLRTSIGVGTGDSPQFTDLTLTGGDITLTGAATDIDVIDNTASALSFDATDKAGILEIDSTNSKEQVKMSGGLFVSGQISGSGNIISGSSFIGSSLALDTSLPVSSGGTGASSLTDKAVLISQDSGTDAIGSLAMTRNGEIIVGGTSGPAVEAAADVAGTGLDASVGDGTLAINVAAAQTSITSLINTGLTKIGTATDQEYIKFDTSNEVNTHINNTERLSVTAVGVEITGHVSASGNITGSIIEASGDVIAFGSSDRRLKDNITPIENPLEKMDKIGGYTFVWNDNQSTYTGKDVGVVAQEIEEILPELVTTRGTGYKAVKYEKIVPLLIESIKELQKKVQKIEENCDCLNK